MSRIASTLERAKNVLCSFGCFAFYSYVSMEEQLAACESHLQGKTDEVEVLQKEVYTIQVSY